RADPIAVSAEVAHRRPVRHRWRRNQVIQRFEISSAVDNPAAYDREVTSDAGDLAVRTGEEVAVRHDQIRELADLDAALPILFVREPGDILSPHPKRGLAIETIALRVKAQPAHRHARDEPGERDPGIV